MDARSPQLRPGNLKKGTTQYGLDRAVRHCGTCELIAVQIICYESEGVLADGHPQTIGDVLLFPGKADYAEWLKKEAAQRNRVANTCDKVQCLDPAVFGRDLEKHEAAHSEQWSHYKGRLDYGISYGAWQLESKLSCGEWGRCNKFEVDANPFHGGYWNPPVVGPEGYFVPGPRTLSMEVLERFGL